jgi:RNA polymerase sigma-70 factor (ECF subfamily)
MQKVHYIGIPLRFDLILAESKNLSLYLGAGIQADKCLWATAWGKTLHEKEVLWSATCAAGLQVNLTPSSSIYLEPELSRALNTGSLQTYRSEESSTVSIRAGIRFTLK